MNACPSREVTTALNAARSPGYAQDGLPNSKRLSSAHKLSRHWVTHGRQSWMPAAQAAPMRRFGGARPESRDRTLLRAATAYARTASLWPRFTRPTGLARGLTFARRRSLAASFRVHERRRLRSQEAARGRRRSCDRRRPSAPDRSAAHIRSGSDRAGCLPRPLAPAPRGNRRNRRP